jgi:PAS domain S-box-containing protein
MTADPKVLILEDNSSDADLLCRELKKSGLKFISRIVQNRSAYESALAEFSPDIILSDYSLPAFDAVMAFKIKQLHLPLVPFIIVSGFIGEENAIELINSGVTDYVSKTKLATLSIKVNKALNGAAAFKEKLITDEKAILQAAALLVANKELVYQNEEKEKRAVDLLLLTDHLKLQQVELQNANLLLIRQEERVVIINAELSKLNQELEDRVASRTKALAESENRFRNMMETIPQIAWTNTIKGEIQFFNQRWYDYTGLDMEQTRTVGFATVIHPDDLKAILKDFGLIRKTIEGGEFQTRVKRVDGLYRWHLIRLMPIKNEIGQLQLWAGTATDIQELRLLQQQKDDFISIASHELKTPITSLKASLQLLLRMKDNPSPAMLPNLIVQANKSLGKVNVLVEDLLNASKANTGQLHITPKHFLLVEAVNECCNDLINEGNYVLNIWGDKDIQVYADVTRIGQVVLNFVTNAVKYAPDSKEISICIENINGMAKVSVIDKGAGISSQHLRFLFDRYYRVDHNGSHYTGLGLGLYICSEIIKKHHGTIGVESELGKGSVFWFTLPVSQT